MSDSVEQVFTRTAATYDQDRAKLIPGFEAFYNTAVGLLATATDHVLDLGAGTGLLAAFVRERFPDVTLHLVDSSEAMLAQSRERFARDRKIALLHGDYTTCAWGRPYDAIVSALSIHHLTDAAKQALFVRVREALKPGGVFVNAEQILQPTPEAEAAAKQKWLAQVRALGATDAQIEASLLRQTEDRCATLEDQLRWLQAAGFTGVRCAWHEGRFAVMFARRPDFNLDAAVTPAPNAERIH